MKCKTLWLFLMATIFSAAAFSQEKKPAVISGSVKDANTKLPLTEAVVTVSSSAFDGQKFALTDSTGMYRINNLPSGSYKIAFEMEGYEKFTQENISVRDGMSLGISFQMVKERKAKNKNVQTSAKDTSSTGVQIDTLNFH